MSDSVWPLDGSPPGFPVPGILQARTLEWVAISFSNAWKWKEKVKLSAEELMLLNCGVGEDSWESLGLQGDPTSQSWRKSVLNMHWKDWCWNWNSNTLATWCKELTRKDPDAGKDWRWEEKETTKDEMIGWHHQLNGHESEKASGVGDGQGSLEYCSPWGCKESDMTEWLNWKHL